MRGAPPANAGAGDMTNVLCPIWGTHAVEEARGADSQTLRSDRAGGRYQIGGTAASMVSSLTDAEKAKLTTWLVDQHLGGVETPVINSDHVRDAKTRRPLRHAERKRRFFELLTRMDWGVADNLKVGGTSDDKMFVHRNRVAAWTELDESKEVGPFINLLAAENLLVSGNGGFNYSLTPKGFEELERVQSGDRNSRLAFVAM